MSVLAPELKQSATVLVIAAGHETCELPTSLPSSTGHEPAAVIVLAGDGDSHPELWPEPAVPVLVVLPPDAPAAAVVAAFASGADACVQTRSSAEVTAHLGALLRRTALAARVA